MSSKGKGKMKMDSPDVKSETKSPSETTIESAATMEVAMQIKERDMRIKMLEDEIGKMQLESDEKRKQLKEKVKMVRETAKQ